MIGITCRVCGMNCERWSRNQGLICKPCHLAKRRGYYRAVRRDNELEYQRRYYARNKQAIREHQAAHQASPERRAAYSKKWREKNIRERLIAERAVVEELRPAYIAQRLGVPVAAIDPVLLEAKRLHIMIMRKLKEAENEEHQRTA